MKKKLFYTVLLVSLVALFLVPVAFAQGEVPPTNTAHTADLNAEFFAFLILITGFFKERFGVKGNLVLGIGFAVGLVLYYAPLLPLGEAINGFVEFVKFFLGGAGAFDTTVDVLSRVGKKPKQ